MQSETSEGEAYLRLHAEIAEGALSPNARLVEKELADRYGLSRPAVRTALIRLEHDGLVMREPNRGARVRFVTSGEAVQILETRAVLEGLAARHAALLADASDVAGLQEIVAEMSCMHDRGDLIAISTSNARLHRRIVEISEHGTVGRLTALLAPQLVRFAHRTILQPGRFDRSLDEHRQIVAAIAAHDADRAERTMRTHLTNVGEALRDRAEPEASGRRLAGNGRRAD